MSYDPYDDAMSDEPDVWFGQVQAESFLGFFKTGEGAVPYNEDAHGPDQKHYLIIHFEFVPIDPVRKIFSRYVGKWTMEFQDVLRSSLLALDDQLAAIKGLIAGQFNPLRAINGMYVKCLRVPNPDNKPGETWTTMSFQQVYLDEATCVAVWEAHSGKELGGSPVADMPFMPDESDPPRPDPQRARASGERVGKQRSSAEVKAATSEPQRASMAAFLPVLWKQADRDMVKMAGLLEEHPMISQYFTLESPEVVAVMQA